MRFEFTLLTELPFINPLHNTTGVALAALGWLACLGVIGVMARHWRSYNRSLIRKHWLILLALAAATPLTSLYIGIRLPYQLAASQPMVPVDQLGVTWMIFAALPWMLAAGFTGLLPGMLMAGASGALLALWESHNPFTPLVYAALAMIFAALVHQRYRTRWFSWLRSPFIASGMLALVYPLLFLAGAILAQDGSLPSRLDLALTRLMVNWLAAAGQLLVAGVFCEAFRLGWQHEWSVSEALLPSPAEKSLQMRFIYQITPLALLLTILLMGVTWYAAESAARRLLEERIQDAARSAAQGIPYFLETGQDLVQRMVEDPQLYLLPEAELPDYLARENRTIPFFSQLFILDSEGHSRTGYPQTDYAESMAPAEERAGIQRALQGVPPVQYYPLPPVGDGLAARVSFIAAIREPGQPVKGVLVGRANLEDNPFTKPILNSLQSLAEIEGEGILVDDSGMILYHPDANLLMSSYTGRMATEPASYDESGPDGARRLVFAHPAIGRPWLVALHVPARYAQKLALDIATPLLGMILVVALVSAFSLRFTLRRVTESLRNLAVQSSQIAQGELDTALLVQGEDEVGQLRRAFEQMRLSLQARLAELNRLLAVSQGVAASLEADAALKPVLEAALSSGASCSRVVLHPTALPDVEDRDGGALITFSVGASGEAYAYLDAQILEMAARQERIILNNLTRARVLRIPPAARRPEAFLALPIRHENQYFGALWVAYDQPHRFTDEEVRFITTLAGQAALAVANARLFMSAELGRQRLAAVLASTPDPVLVTDQANKLLLSNPAAWRVLGIGTEWEEGQPVEQVIHKKELLDLLNAAGSARQAAEVPLGDGKVYYVTASPVISDGQPVGRVCILRDITYFKELDALKSEFVATVSHDLRSPLTLVRGYATMLEMVGELNEQQSNYVRRIVTGVESMSRLVSNLLDLGRIEAGVGLQLEIVPVPDIVERVASALQLQATQKRVQLTTSVPEQTIPLIEADQALLQQALHNLVDNAIKYTEPNGQVKLRVNVRGDSMVFEVQDTGIGIAPVDQPHLFDKFYRGAQQAGKKSGGSGLGLAIVKSIAERHGGKVWVESQLGKGSTFYLSIPLRQPKSDPKYLDR
jgi:PAS domain S-box-containing protein